MACALSRQAEAYLGTAHPPTPWRNPSKKRVESNVKAEVTATRSTHTAIIFILKIYHTHYNKLMKPTQILLSSLLISLALSQALQKQSGFALIETHQIEENQADLIRSNALSEELITELIARLNEDEAQPKTSEKKLSQSS